MQSFSQAQSSPPSWDIHFKTISQLLLDRRIILFAGAGLSHLCNPATPSGTRLPLWDGLIEFVRLEFEVPPEIQGVAVFDYAEVCAGRQRLCECVAARLDDASVVHSNAHHALKQLPWNGIYTTNFDLLLSRLYDTKPIVGERDYCDDTRLSQSTHPKIIHIHGAISDPLKITLTKSDYKRWRERHPAAANRFLTALLDNSMLIVGYGIGDPHIQEMIEIVNEWRHNECLPTRTYYAWLWKMTDAQRILLQKEGIEAFSIQNPEDWATAFGLLEAEYAETLRKATGSEASSEATNCISKRDMVFGDFVMSPWAVMIARNSDLTLDEVYEALLAANSWEEFFDHVQFDSAQRAHMIDFTRKLIGSNNPVQNLNSYRVTAGLLPL